MDAAVAARSQAIDLVAERPFRVGAAAVDPVSRDAAFGGQSERLQPQNLKVLIALARQRGKVVTREQLVDQCWDGRFIGEDVINRAISTLRQFAERAGGFSIETVPRAGYRLVETSPRQRRRHLWALAIVAVGFAALLFAWFMGDRSSGPKPATAPTIAIVPFTSASADPAARELAAAAHDALAHTLSQTEFPIRLLNVPPRPSASAIGLLLSGEAEVGSGKARVTVRMVDSANQIVVYSRQFEGSRKDASTLADQVGGQVAGSLGWTVSSLALDRRQRTDPAILAELFREVGNYSSDLGALPNYAALRRLAAKAPNSAIVQGSLAINSAFVLADLPRDQRPEALALGRRASDRVVALAPDSGGSYIPWCALHSRARLIECEDRLRTGMRIDPDSPWVDFFLADWIKNTGRLEEALRLARHSLAHDQYTPAKIGLALRLFEGTGDDGSADRLFRESQRWWPGHLGIFWGRVYGMADRGDFEAIGRFANEAGSSNGFTSQNLVGGLPKALKERNLAAVRDMCPHTLSPSPRREFCMLALARLGDNDRAFAFADASFPDRVGRTPAEQEQIFLDSPWVPDADILTGPAAAPMRRDPRYLELARRLGLLAYWRRGRLPDFCRSSHPEPVCGQLR